MSQSRQLAAIMFTDIVGYTALMGNNEQKAFELLRKNREIQKPVIEEFGGRWIKELGDGVMASFPSVSNAVYAAIKIQDTCYQADAFELRIGIHLGEVVFENDDIFGDAVNIASRLQTLAPPGGIFVSASVQRDLANKNDIRSEFFGVENLKNVKEPVQVYQIYSAGKEPIDGGSATNVNSLSIMPNYEYDIFVSYRDNDNKYDGWVTEFVEKLTQELDATLKDKVSIFFDKNPREGLQDAHYVDQSTRAKIKSLIFIPIISQTYCDTTSFIWQHEFQAFNREINSDLLGKSIRLANGNFASRILPIKIHEIEPDDVRLLEKELAGIMRSVDFIYQESGVNRPLRPVDDSIGANSGRLYRNQINKVANAIKEIINGVKKGKKELKQPESNISITASPSKTTSVDTTLHESIRVAILDQERPNVFLAWTSQDLKSEREEMAIILQKAGFNVYPSTDCPADDSGFKKVVEAEMAKSSCSLHILSNEFGRRFELNDEMSFPQFQFEEAKKRSLDTEVNFNTFIWYTPKDEQAAKQVQLEFIKQIRNNITRNMMFSNSPGPMQLVDDMRVVMMKETIKQFDANETDIFFIFNQQDEASASLITDLISAEYPVEIMNILPDGEEEYREISAQQIPKSKLAVVYFKYAADWALPFIKQVWKQVGGASSPTPMMLIGEDDPESNRARVFKAPKVVSFIVPKDTVPSEVKKVYVQVLNLD